MDIVLSLAACTRDRVPQQILREVGELLPTHLDWVLEDVIEYVGGNVQALRVIGVLEETGLTLAITAAAVAAIRWMYTRRDNRRYNPPQPDYWRNQALALAMREINRGAGERFSSPMAMGLRLRPRSRLTHAMRALCGLTPNNSSTIRDALFGRWVPDLTTGSGLLSRVMLDELLSGRASVFGGGRLQSERENDDGERESFVWANVDFNGRAMFVCPELLAKLQAYVAFRPRDYDLLLSLRTRAMEWCKGHHLGSVNTALLLPGTVACAMMLSQNEETAISMLKTREVLYSRLVTESLKNGVNVSRWPNVMRQLFPWRTTSGGFAGC